MIIVWMFGEVKNYLNYPLAIKALPVKRLERTGVFHTPFHFPARCQTGSRKTTDVFVHLTVSVGSQPSLCLLVTSVGSGRVGSLIDPAKSSTVMAWLGE